MAAEAAGQISQAGLAVFLAQAVAISLTGVMAPGAVTAATIAQGTRSRWAGALISVGHGVVEFPLMILIVLGVGAVFQLAGFKIAVGLLGGLFLLWLAWQMLFAAPTNPVGEPAPAAEATAATTPTLGGTAGPIMTGIVLTGGNPYFLLWWATVGVALATQASEMGVLAFALFAVIHWMCDLVWLSILSFASYHGTTVMGPKVQHVVLRVCGAALAGFGVWFLYDATRLWLG